MDINDMVNKAKDALGGEEAAEDKIQQAAEFIKDKTPDQADEWVDKAADLAHDQVDTDGR